MDYLINKNIKKVIKDTLDIKDESVNESLVAQEKSFKLNTEFLTGRNKKNHVFKRSV